MQLAKTRCWAMYSNWGEKQMNWDKPWGPARPQSPVGGPDPGPPHLVDVIELEVLEQKEQHGRNGFDDDLLVPIDVHPQLHALQYRGPEGHRGTLGLGHCHHPRVSGDSPALPRALRSHPQPAPCTIPGTPPHRRWSDQPGSLSPNPRSPQLPPVPPSRLTAPQHSTRSSRSLTASPPAGHRPGC